MAWRRDALGEGAPKVLLIDERSDNHAALERVAARVAAHVHHARSVADALRCAMKFSYDAVIMDASLEGEALSLLEQLSRMQTTAAILVSGQGLRFPDGFRLGGNLLGSVRTPWDDEEIESGLRRALELSAARRSQPTRAALSHAPGFERVLLLGGAATANRLESMTRGFISPGGLLRAASLEEGLCLLVREPVDLVITHLCLPDACGLDAVLRLRRVSPQIPIVVLTASDDAALSEQALHAGAQDVLLEGALDAPVLLRSLRHARHRQRVQAQLHHGALHDELTSLAKRTLLHQRIANALSRSRRMGNTFAVIYIDLDHFKAINDTHGHDIGDGVLVAVSQRLRAAVRDYDTVARLGGDEFAILLDTLENPAEAEIVAQRVLSSVSLPVIVADRELGVTASMGISVFPEGGNDPDDMLRAADHAMYCAKRAGRNTYSLMPLGDGTAPPPSGTRPPGPRTSSVLPAARRTLRP